jgi:threonine/homoserine/homoserine lactone efflux protein
VSNAAPLILYGFLLGWSVAWPPGPINAEMIRRGLARGFAPAFAVGLGACSGDALWAFSVILGAGVLLGPTARAALGWISMGLLFLLAAVFLSSALQDWRRRGMSAEEAVAPRPSSAQSGYWLGLGMALTSPWNFAFWLAVIGRSDGAQHGLWGAITTAAAVILGAASWCVLLCTATARLRVVFGGGIWPVVAKAATGVLMLGFAFGGVFSAAR